MFNIESTNATMQSELFVSIAAVSICFLSVGLNIYYAPPGAPPVDVDPFERVPDREAGTPTFVFSADQDEWELGSAKPPESVRWRIKNHLVPLIERISVARGYDVLEIRGHTDSVAQLVRSSVMDGPDGESVGKRLGRLLDDSPDASASNVELGLQRALQIKKILDEHVGGEVGESLGRIRYIHAFSAGEFIAPNGDLPSADSPADPSRRRVEIRLSRLPACPYFEPETCGANESCVWIPGGVGCLGREYSHCLRHEEQAACDDGHECVWLPASWGASWRADARWQECVPKELDIALQEEPDEPLVASGPPEATRPLHAQGKGKKVCVLDGSKPNPSGGRGDGTSLRADEVCTRLEDLGWKCRPLRFNYDQREPAGKRDRFPSHVVRASSPRALQALRADLEGDPLGTALDETGRDAGRRYLNGAEYRENVGRCGERTVVFVGREFYGRSPIVRAR